MTPKAKSEAIKTKLAADLPALITGASLADFESYQSKSPKVVDQRILAVYIAEDDDSTDAERFSVIILCQIYKPIKGTDEQDYHNVIYPYMRENLTPDIVDMQIREMIQSTLIPSEPSTGGTSFIGYEVGFSGQLDGCD